MLKLLEGFGDETIAIETHGEITRSDYEEVLIPRAKEILETYEKVKCFMHITEGSTYSMGAVATDTVFGLRHLFAWERIALVTDVEWVHKAAGFFLPLMPFEAKLFSEKEYEYAKTWLES
ncbi:SpoIIAA family protein [Halodesulfovibrio spirochaetisodalis]|uniref:STAS/SEC14 domain-containing protein n=1 Tax=Halodesulfovibrio spirochaetisodalis TaxID=1560234 RepID=A0A1B7XH38_9BACT|nr:STAS/SEC14 domain-containing protein [Halodesulfovibrio spirochaetisodalis]OBQ54805.1 hypothetical protein SP90_04785 [Halodesulfovibrio spirochaetisodalis]